MRRPLYEIYFNVVDIQCHFNFVVIWRESQTGDFANEDLFTYTLASRTVGFEKAVRRKDAVSYQCVKS